MTRFTPEELENRLQEIASNTGEPYISGENSLVDMAMRLQNANHPQLPLEAIEAIRTALILSANAATNPPQLNGKMLTEIEAQLHARMQLQAAPRPVISDEALNRIEATLQLANAPKPVLSDEALLRIEKQLHHAIKPQAPFMSAVASVLILFGFLLVVATLLPENINFLSNPTEEPTEPYTSGMAVELDTSTPESAIKPTIADLVNPETSPEPTDSATLIAPTAIPTVINLIDRLDMPAIVIIDGTLSSIDDETITIFNFVFVYDYDPTLLDNYEVGDLVHIEGVENPSDAGTYLILSIEPIYTANAALANIGFSISSEPVNTAITIDEPSVSGSTTSTTDVSATSSTSNNTTVSGGSTGNTPSNPPQTNGNNSSNDDDDNNNCRDGDDSNRGRGQECNNGRGNRGNRGDGSSD